VFKGAKMCFSVCLHGVTNFEDNTSEDCASGRLRYENNFVSREALLSFHNNRFVPSGPFSPLLAVVL
jgi:hypothetical protein